ncbi:MAG: S9 family peptidase [Sphingomonas sp.]|nr:MAG: S9 family peptidase [Sphingomonas sp.]
MSPDGQKVAYLAPAAGQGTVLAVQAADPAASVRLSIRADGNPERLSGCLWVAADRLVCRVYGLYKNAIGTGDILPMSRLIAIDENGSNIQMLSVRENFFTRGTALWGGSVIDQLPAEDGEILMTRSYMPDDRILSRLGSTARGLAVDKVNTRTLKTSRVEAPRDRAAEYISDGAGQVRIMGMAMVHGETKMLSGVTSYLYRRQGSREWQPLSQYDSTTREGFNPYAVDSLLDVAYGFRKIDGRDALVRKKLDGSGTEEVVVSRPDVDIDELIRIGRANRVIGASYATDRRIPVIFDPEMSRLIAALSKSIPGNKQLSIVDSSADERKLLVFASADNDPGVYYLFDRDKRELKTFLVARPELEGVKLATVRHITYPASDGTMVPGYLTLPPDSQGKNLPAIVLPHGGPSARDEWGFDWLSQYFAHMGYAVLQPNFRGSAGYGDAWFEQNGFQSWRTAINDVSDAGRWLVREGIADPERLGIVGWSYGGYAALQSAAVNPDLFKAVVAIAPVTDLEQLKASSRNWSDHRINAEFIGTGTHTREGSPAQNAQTIKAPVLMFHGDHDLNVDIAQSRYMKQQLERAGKSSTLVAFPGLDHYIEDGDARAKMLRESDTFLRKSFGD